MVDEKQIRSMVLKLALGFFVFALLVYAIAYDQFRYSTIAGDTLSATMTTGEIVDGEVIEQRLSISADSMVGLDLRVYNYDRVNTGTLHIELLDSELKELCEVEADISGFINSNEFFRIALPGSFAVAPGMNEFYLRMYTEGSYHGNAIAFYSGNSVTTGRFDIYKEIAREDAYSINGDLGEGMLCARLIGVSESSFYKTYWVIILLFYVLLIMYCHVSIKKMRSGRNCFMLEIVNMLTRYRFLLKQLVIRDFKVKYKRSYLGMAWSLLNPLLSMAVQYVIFSNIFRADIPNYPVYLLTGIVVFNALTTSVQAGIEAITSNASLIKKVYLPKYVYPVSKVYSSAITFILSFLPIFIVMLITGTEFHLSLLLLSYSFLCLFIFIMGLILFLSTVTTFFQDVVFIWSVVSMVWMYATPIFYPETIIPNQLLTLYHMNPMYQFVTFTRVCIIDGVSPAPSAYLWCLLPAVCVFILGVVVFKKNQDKFVLYV